MTDDVVTLDGFAHGGEAVGRLGDGRAVFVGYAIPGETVRVELRDVRKRWARGWAREVLEASQDRVAPPCPYFSPQRCGGCRLQHIAAPRRRELLGRVVSEQLQRLGRVDAPVAPTVDAGAYGYRSRARFSADDHGRLGFRRAASAEIVPIDRCLLLDEPTQQLRDRAGDDWPPGASVEIRTGVSGEEAVSASAGDPPVASRALPEAVEGLGFQVSPGSFFQSNRAGAAALLRLVRDAAAVGSGDSALDLYAGVGLFAKGLAADGARVVAVESSRSAARDARRNLAGSAEVRNASVETAVDRLSGAGQRSDVVVLDPPRSGAGSQTIIRIASLARRRIIYVACDPAALARDTRALTDAGWTLSNAVPVDQFAQTGQIEVVATFVPTAA